VLPLVPNCLYLGLLCCRNATSANPSLSSAKKRPRVAAAPERYADLVSNMTSQGGGEDTDSDADDGRDDTYAVRKRMPELPAS
jgi:hypothetical protein